MVEKQLITYHIMKRIIIALSLALMFVSCVAYGQKQNYVIGFYNLENLFDIYNDPAKNDEQFLPEGSNKWTEAKYTKKLHNMASVIRAMRDDNGRYHTILGVSEIENRLVLEDLISQPEIADANYQIVHFDSPDRRGVDVAFLYDPRSFAYIDSEAIPFTFEGTTLTPDMTEEEMADFRTRDIVMLRGTIGGEMCAFYVAHLPSRVGGKSGFLRSRGAEIIYAHAMALMEEFPGIKIAVMGDMNDDPFDESMKVMMHGQKDIKAVTPTEFFNPFYSMLENGYGTLCYQGTWSIYDQILVNNNFVNAPKGSLQIRKIVKNKYYGRVFKKPWMTQESGQYKGYPFRTFSGGAFIGGYSDHYPTYIVISK